MELTEDHVQTVITTGGALLGVVVGLVGQHPIGARQRRAKTQRERLEALQEAGFDYAVAAERLEA